MDRNITGTVPANLLFRDLLLETSSLHRHLCPRQVLGVRLGLCGLISLGFREKDFKKRFFNRSKRLLVFAETDGCGMDGIAIATDCAVGRRTLRVIDYGKVAATFVDTSTGKSLRVAPTSDARNLAFEFASEALTAWQRYLLGYQRVPDELLFSVQTVELTDSLDHILGQPGVRSICQNCGEEIMNMREVHVHGEVFCISCAGDSYYRL